MRIHHIINLTKAIILFGCYQVAHAEPYVGANIGGSMLTVNKTLSYNTTNAKLSDKYSGFRGQLLAGWNVHLQKEMNPEDDPSFTDDLYFAFEADANYISGKSSTTVTPWFLTTSISTQAKLQWSYDLLLIGKYRLAPNIIVFAGPGFSQGTFKVTTSSQTAGNLGVTKNGSQWLTGWTAKAGLELVMTNYMNLVVTYQYNNFENATWSSTEPLTGNPVSGKYQPIINSIMVGANWCINI